MAAPQVAAPQWGPLGTKAQMLEDHQAYCSQKFHYYRNGLGGHQLTAVDINDGYLNGDPVLTNRWNDILARRLNLPPPQPPLGLFQFTANHRERLRAVAVANRVALRTLGTPPRGPIDRQTKEAVKREYESIYPQMRASFRYFKCLGWGGEGVTSLWRYSPGPRQNHMVVMKMSFATETIERPVPQLKIDTEYIDKERQILSQLGRAPHIVQRFYTAHHPRIDVSPNATRRSRRQAQAVATIAQDVDSHHGDSYFFMELCKFGNLEAQLRRAARDGPNRTERYFPEPVLWHFFDCLVKGAMAMEEPPMQNPASTTLPADSRGGFLAEQITAFNPGREGIVHLDLDPSNVFIYGYDPPNLPAPLVPGHTDLPRLQIADFGMARNEATVFQHARDPALGFPWAPIAPTSAELDRRLDRWSTRHLGKWMNTLPEQFGKEWDLVPRFEDPTDTWSATNWPPPWMQPWAPPPPITSGPARYTAASNVWHIGMIMKVAMTLMDPDIPPFAGRARRAEPANATPAQERWTYGWSLIDIVREPWVNMYSPALRSLVASCLMAKQENRPSLRGAQQIIAQQLAMPANQQIDPYYRNTFFREPPRPRPPPDTADVDNINPFWDYRKAEPMQ